MGRGLFARRRRLHDLTGKKLIRQRKNVETVLLGDNWELAGAGGDPQPQPDQLDDAGAELPSANATAPKEYDDTVAVCLPPTPPPSPPTQRTPDTDELFHRSRKMWWSARGFSFPVAQSSPPDSVCDDAGESFSEVNHTTDSDFDDDVDSADHLPQDNVDSAVRHDGSDRSPGDGALAAVVTNDDDVDDDHTAKTRSSKPRPFCHDTSLTELCERLELDAHSPPEPRALLPLEPKAHQHWATPHPRRRLPSPIQLSSQLAAAPMPSMVPASPPLSPVQPTSAPGLEIPLTPNGSPVFTTELLGHRAAEVVAMHNRLRAAHGAPPLEWDLDCAQHAAAAATDNASVGVMHHCHFGAEATVLMGQNIFFFERPDDLAPGDEIELLAVATWYSEIELYDFAKARHQPGTGHASQLLWHGTRKVGVALSPDGRYVVANYAPHGNVRGQYGENLTPAVQRPDPSHVPTPPVRDEGALLMPPVRRARREPTASAGACSGSCGSPEVPAQRGLPRARGVDSGRSHSSSIAQRRKNRGGARIRLETT